MHPKLVSDSSTLILLIKSGLVEYILRTTTIIIPQKVYEESVKIPKETGYKDAYEIDNLVIKKKIKIGKVDEKTAKKFETMFKLAGGEKDSLALAFELKLPMLCDDKKGRNAAKVLNIKTISAISLLEALCKKRRINKKMALKSLDKLQKYGWYKEDLIDYVRRKIENVKTNIPENT